MLVYANVIHTAPRPDAVQAVLSATGDWLAWKTHEFISAKDLVDQYSRRLTDGKEVAVNIAGSASSYPILASVVFGHPDNAVAGRKWLTRIGIRQESATSGATVTIVVETSDISVRAGMAHAFATRPGVVTNIIKSCGVAPNFPGPSVRPLGATGFESLANAIEDRDRQHAIVIVTPEPYSEKALTDPSDLADMLVGLAEVYLVTNKRDTFGLAQALGRDRAAWNGSIRVLYPSRGPSNFVLSDLLMPEQIKEIRSEGRSFKSYVLFNITHRLNLAKARLEITPQQVRQHALSTRLVQLHAVAKDKATIEEELQLYQEVNKQIEEQVATLKRENSDLYSALDKAEGEVERLKIANQALQHHLSQKSGEVTEVIPEVPRQFESMNELAEVIETEMANEIVLTNKAKRAMKDSPFTRYSQVYDAFRVLQGQFLPMFRDNGQRNGVDAALQQAGIEYSPHMSETTLGQFEDYNALYKGRKADFNKHLKLGKSFDPKHSFRIHFEWDAEDQRIVVHYAGRHLTNSKS